jgi:hypothetical protein
VWLASTLRESEGKQAIVAYQNAMEVLPRAAWPGMSLRARHDALAMAGRHVCEAGAHAISMHVLMSQITSERGSLNASNIYLRTAIELLEQGRGVVWGQLLQMRSPVEDLRAVDPELAERIEMVGKELSKGNGRSKGDSIFPGDSFSADALPARPSAMEQEDEISNQKRLAREWDSLLVKAREKEGFESFMRGKKMEDVVDVADEGPVVVVNVNEERSDAIILRALVEEKERGDRVELLHVHLEGFPFRLAKKLQELLGNLSRDGFRSRAPFIHNGHPGMEGEVGGGIRDIVQEFGLGEEFLVDADAPATATNEPTGENLADDLRETHPSRGHIVGLGFILKVLWLRVVRPIVQRLNLPVSYLISLTR